MNSPESPSPELFLKTIHGYRDSAAIKGAVELNLFTVIGSGSSTVADIARDCSATERGIRILCDHLAILGFIEKTGEKYVLTRDSSIFLDKNSPAYMGDVVFFLLDPFFVKDIGDVAEIVRNGTIADNESSNEPEHPMWVTFARAMSGLQGAPAEYMAGIIDVKEGRTNRVLDIAAGSGLFGVKLAEKYENVEVTALDWPNVLEVASENAQASGVSERHKLLPGNAFEVEPGQD